MLNELDKFINQIKFLKVYNFNKVTKIIGELNSLTSVKIFNLYFKISCIKLNSQMLNN